MDDQILVGTRGKTNLRMPLVLRYILSPLVIFNFLPPRAHWAYLTVHTAQGALFPLKKCLSVGVMKGAEAEGKQLIVKNHFGRSISKLLPSPPQPRKSARIEVRSVFTSATKSDPRKIRRQVKGTSEDGIASVPARPVGRQGVRETTTSITCTHTPDPFSMLTSNILNYYGACNRHLKKDKCIQMIKAKQYKRTDFIIDKQYHKGRCTVL